MFLASSIILLILILFLSHYVFRPDRTSYLVAKLPGPPELPFFRHLFYFLVSPEKLWTIWRDMNIKLYPIYKISLPTVSVVNILDPDDVEVLLTSTQNIAKSMAYETFRPWLNDGLLISTGNKWQTRRKILTPTFHFNVLRQFVSTFDKEGRRMVRDLKNQDGKDGHELASLITKYTLNLICETAMGTSLEEKTNVESKYRKSVHKMGGYMIHRMFRPWLYPEFIFNNSPTGRNQIKTLDTLHGFSTKIIRDRVKYHEDTGNVYLKDNKTSYGTSSSRKKLAMLDLLIAAMKDGQIDELGIREEADTFIFEGHDTTGMGMIFILLLLAEHKDIQQMARDEIDAVLEKSGGKLEIGELQSLIYLDRCIKESLRLYPSVPGVSRFVEEEMRFKNYTIPRGIMATVHIYDIHRDPKFWPDPLTFDPDRFLPERCVGRHPFSYIPFSAGPRNCIGQKFAMLSLKALVGHLLHKFYFEPIDVASQVPLSMDMVIRPAAPVRIRIIPR